MGSDEEASVPVPGQESPGIVASPGNIDRLAAVSPRPGAAHVCDTRHTCNEDDASDEDAAEYSPLCTKDKSHLGFSPELSPPRSADDCELTTNETRTPHHTLKSSERK